MTEQACYLQIKPAGIATITLNRPKVHNALDQLTIAMLMDYLGELDKNPSVRAVIVRSSGKNFCSGADLKEMQNSINQSAEENIQTCQNLANLMWTLHHLSKPTIALVQGVAYGGGAGLVTCCDIALAAQDATFCFSEVRLGLIPSVISPYVVRAIGTRMARRYFLTAERFSTEEACRIGLIHEVVATENLQESADKFTKALIAGGPHAMTRTKALMEKVTTAPLDTALTLRTAQWIAGVRQSEEAREGMSAFLERRKASWVQAEETKL